jgi:serine protease Do
VRLSDGRNLVGEVLRSDKVRDVALLRTDPVAFDVFALRAEEARTGEEVFALGSPLGKVLSGTLTRGVLSARRVIEGVSFLQSDVAVNPGNSGGPLIDGQGRVVGIAQIGGSEGGLQGLGLFVPIQEAMDQLALKLGDGTGVAQSGR